MREAGMGALRGSLYLIILFGLKEYTGSQDKSGYVKSDPFYHTKRRGAEMNERIIIDPEIQHGKPVIRGTRVPITRIVGGLAGGMTKKEIMREYEVTEEDIWAALSYATELIEAEEFHPLPVPAG